MREKRGRRENPKTLDPVGEDGGVTGKDGKGFYACYILTSLSPRHKGHTYIGYLHFLFHDLSLIFGFLFFFWVRFISPIRFEFFSVDLVIHALETKDYAFLDQTIVKSEKSDR